MDLLLSGVAQGPQARLPRKQVFRPAPRFVRSLSTRQNLLGFSMQLPKGFKIISSKKHGSKSEAIVAGTKQRDGQQLRIWITLDRTAHVGQRDEDLTKLARQVALSGPHPAAQWKQGMLQMGTIGGVIFARVPLFGSKGSQRWQFVTYLGRLRHGALQMTLGDTLPHGAMNMALAESAIRTYEPAK